MTFFDMLSIQALLAHIIVEGMSTDMLKEINNYKTFDVKLFVVGLLAVDFFLPCNFFAVMNSCSRKSIQI